MVPMMTTTTTTTSNNNNQVLRNSFSDHKFHSRSKAQMCLKKIIDIIISSSSSSSGYSSSSSSKSKSKSKELIHEKISTRVRRGIDIDLNLRLGLPSEEESEEEVMMNKGFSACSVVIGRDGDCNSSSVVVSGGECVVEKSNHHEVSKGKQVVVDEQEISEITNLLPIPEVVVVVTAAEEEETEKKKFQRVKNEEGYLGLLIEAARLISGEDFEEINEPDEDEEKRKSGDESIIIRNRSKKNESWMLDLYDGFEDISPVVKSKRGRNQVLPFRYRDSVLDPWKRLSRQRSSKNKQDLH